MARLVTGAMVRNGDVLEGPDGRRAALSNVEHFPFIGVGVDARWPDSGEQSYLTLGWDAAYSLVEGAT